MQVELRNAAKHFDDKAVLRRLDLELKPGDRFVIRGPNGSGKSTLLKLISAFLRPSEGEVIHSIEGKPIDPEKAYRHIALVAPSLFFPQELTVDELIRTWQRFRPELEAPEGIPELVRLEKARDRRVRELSSGMLQRLRLGIAFRTPSPFLLLDEPLSNMDAQGRELYHELLAQEGPERAILVCSNHPEVEAPREHRAYRIENKELRPEHA